MVGFLLILAPLLRRSFDRLIQWLTHGYAGIVQRIVALRGLNLVLIGAFVGGVVGVHALLPSGFIPGEDQGTIYAILQTPPGSTLEYTNAKAQQLEDIAKTVEGVASVTSLAGYEVLTEGRGSNAGTCIINLQPWSERRKRSWSFCRVGVSRRDTGGLGFGPEPGLAVGYLARAPQPAGCGHPSVLCSPRTSQ